MLMVGLGVIIGFISTVVIHRLFTHKKDVSLEDTEAILRSIRDQVTNYILNDNPRLFNAIAKQKMILNDKGRATLAIFISEAEFFLILQEIVSGDLKYINELHASLIALNVPVGYLGELPIYVSSHLVDAPIFVVGSIKWEL